MRGYRRRSRTPPCRPTRCATSAANRFTRTRFPEPIPIAPAWLVAALAFLRDGDVLAVWRLDRLGRSLPHLIEVIGGLEARGVGFRSLTESIDTTTSGGRLIFHVFGALSQFERDLIRDRTKAGLAAAAARGRKGGRKPVISAEKLQRAREHIANGLNVREAAARLKVGKTALYAALQAASAADS